MPGLDVCPYCRKTCAKCHGDASNGHGFVVCFDCLKQYENKCYVCGGSKRGPGSAGATGPGKVCNKCFKSSKCTICGGRC